MGAAADRPHPQAPAMSEDIRERSTLDRCLFSGQWSELDLEQLAQHPDTFCWLFEDANFYYYEAKERQVGRLLRRDLYNFLRNHYRKED